MKRTLKNWTPDVLLTISLLDLISFAIFLLIKRSIPINWGMPWLLSFALLLFIAVSLGTMLNKKRND